jgi:hypothetical protein
VQSEATFLRQTISRKIAVFSKIQCTKIIRNWIFPCKKSIQKNQKSTSIMKDNISQYFFPLPIIPKFFSMLDRKLIYFKLAN